MNAFEAEEAVENFITRLQESDVALRVATDDLLRWREGDRALEQELIAFPSEHREPWRKLLRARLAHFHNVVTQAERMREDEP